MVNIEGIQVDLVGNINSLLTEWAIFTVEFEYDSKIIICHTLDWTVRKGIISLAKKILSPKVESVDLRQSFLNSEYITVEVKGVFKDSKAELLKNKYELIKSNMTYYPYGYNFLLLVNNDEKPYAFTLHNELIENVSKSAALHIESLKKGPKGRKPKNVYKYDINSGLFIEEYNSINDASYHSGIQASNICMCCNKHIKTAGGYIWSYEKYDIIDIPESNRIKVKQLSETEAKRRAESLLNKQQEFINKN
jgi:hypothetical protein